MNKWNVGIYIRLSQEDGDKEESNSVTNQRELINSYISEDKELNVYDYYIDDGWSGTNFDRPDFKRLIADAENNVINTIIVKDLSRFGRNYIEVGNFIEQVFPQYKIRFISISDKIDNFKNPESLNRIIFPFKNMINEEYCRDISRKIRSENLDKIVLKAIKHQIKLYLKADKLIDEIINQRTDNDTKVTIERIEKEMTEKRKIKQKFYEDWKLGIITKEEYMKYVNGAEKTINILNDRYKKYSEKLEEEEKLNDNKEIFKNIKEYENIKTLNKKLIDDLIDNIYSNEDGSIEIEFKYQDEYKKLLKLAKKIKKNT